MVESSSNIFKIVSKDKNNGILVYKTIDITYKEFLHLIGNNEIIQKEFVELLLNLPFDAIFFETQPITKTKLNDVNNIDEFHFAIINAPELASFAKIGNYDSFINHLNPSSCCDNNSKNNSNNSNNNNDDVVTSFSNLGGDAHLIIPCPPTFTNMPSAVTEKTNQSNNNFGHLLSFLRTASSTTITKVLIRLSKETLKFIEDREKENEGELVSETVWLSTCGTGVPWLHFRLDSRPKYYSYQPFKDVEWKPST